MMALPTGCSVPFTITIEVKHLTDDMIEWFEMAGGSVFEKEWYNARGNRVTQKYVKYGAAKACHYHLNGIGGVRLQFHGNDAATASVFIMKFFDQILSTNLEEQMERASQGFYTY